MPWQRMQRSNSTLPVQTAEHGGTPRVPASGVSLLILGAVPSLKNRRPIYRNSRTGKPFSARSDEVKRYMADFAMQVPPEAKIGLGSMESPLRAIVTAWWLSYRNDADFEIIWDCLQECGVVYNDRWIREKHLYAQIDKANPRAEIWIEEI